MSETPLKAPTNAAEEAALRMRVARNNARLEKAMADAAKRHGFELPPPTFGKAQDPYDADYERLATFMERLNAAMEREKTPGPQLAE